MHERTCDISLDRLASAPRGALRIAEVKAFPISVPLPEHAQVTLGVGRTIKRDAVVTRVRTEDGLTGWGEAHHGRAHTAIAAMINDALAHNIKGLDASDVVGLNARMARALQLTQGSSGAAALAISGVDMALWDVRARAVDLPLCRMLGGAPKAIPAYAGGVALGWDDPATLMHEAEVLVAKGYRAIKQRIGDTVERDLARLEALRDAFGEKVEILADANSMYTPWDVRRVLPRLAELGIRHGLDVHPHASMTALNAAATLQVLCAIEGGGYLEADVSKLNPLRDDLASGQSQISPEGTFVPSEKPGLGIEVNEDFIRDHPPILGSAYCRA